MCVAKGRTLCFIKSLENIYQVLLLFPFVLLILANYWKMVVPAGRPKTRSDSIAQDQVRDRLRVKVIGVTIYLLCIREAAHGILRPALHGHRVPLWGLGPIWLPWVPMSLLRS